MPTFFLKNLLKLLIDSNPLDKLISEVDNGYNRGRIISLIVFYKTISLTSERVKKLW